VTEPKLVNLFIFVSYRVTRANSRDIEFWAVLVNAPSENDSKLVVEIRSNYASFEFTGGAPLATMKQQ